jgi:MoxR-like ATPase
MVSRKKPLFDTAAPSSGTAKAEPERSPDVLREPAERLFAHELAALVAADKHERPPGWRLSPRAVATYVLGGEAGGVAVTPKYLGHRRLVEIAIATLVTDRALLLLGEPGTAKSWLSEHLAAAISGDSQILVQGTAGTAEEHLRYSWNYALLLAEGPSRRALVPSAVYRGLSEGKVVRFEEITRCASEVQDALITLLSEKVLAVPELGAHVQALRGFNVIATANTRDRGVNEMSAALRRRFNIVVLPLPEDIDTEVAIVEKQVRELGTALRLPAAPPAGALVRAIVQVFQELRSGRTSDGRQKVASPKGALSTAEAISVLGSGMALASHFGGGEVSAEDVAAGVLGAVVKEDARDEGVFVEYLENVVRRREGVWEELYRAFKDLL